MKEPLVTNGNFISFIFYFLNLGKNRGNIYITEKVTPRGKTRVTDEVLSFSDIIQE